MKHYKHFLNFDRKKLEKIYSLFRKHEVNKLDDLILIKEGLERKVSETENIDKVIQDAEEKERDSNQILDFTREIKNINEEDKKIIIEALWDIIYSDEDADMYETNLMRRLSGLLYLDSKVVGDIKEKVRQKQK